MARRKDKNTTSIRTESLSKKEHKVSNFKPNISKSLPVISEEKVSSNKFEITPQSKENEDKPSGNVLPKIIIRCEPLNIKKIIYLKNNIVSVEELKSSKQKIKIRDKGVDNKFEDKCNLGSSTSTQSKNSRNSGKPLKTVSKQIPAKEVSFDKNTECNLVKDSKKLCMNQAHLTNENGPAYNCTEDKKIKQQPAQTILTENFAQESYFNTASIDSKTQKMPSISSNSNLGDDFIDLSDNYVAELSPFLKESSQTEFRQKSRSKLVKYHHCDFEGDFSNEQESLTPSSRVQDSCHEISDSKNTKKSFLQNAVKSYINNPQLRCLKETTDLKKGLCVTWLSNNFACSNQECIYSHNALSLFTNRLKQYSSKFIMTIVVSMKSDILFVDIIMAAFEIFSSRSIPVVWVTFLILLVFHVFEPSDSRFLKFWANSARFFCQFNENFAAANGFASLLSIFYLGEKSEEWKIIEFVKIIKQPPIQVPTNYSLLQPVLKVDLPIEFLTDAVQSCITTQKDVQEVYLTIIPKIPVATSPISVIELLLKFSKTLEETNNQAYAFNLKQKIRNKVLSITTKISSSTYPLTASFQEMLASGSGFVFPKFRSDKSEMGVEVLNIRAKYFQPEDDFCFLLAETVSLFEDTNSNMFLSSTKGDNVICSANLMGGICERQINRIKQCFRDYRFDLLGKYLNELRPNVIEQASEIFLELLFQMKISLHQVVDLVKIILLPCKSETASKIIANIALTIVLNLVKINEWKKAHTIISSCMDRQVNIVNGKVFHSDEFSAITQCRIALLLIEIYTSKKNFIRAIELIKKYSLYSSNRSLWGVSSITCDETVRVRILENLLQQIIIGQFKDGAYDLFDLIWKEQKQLSGLVDLRKFANEILILLLNENEEDALTFYEKIKAEVLLNNITTRAILVTLVRHNRLSSAKSLLLSNNQNVYALSKISLDFMTVVVKSFWLEEEIYIFFDTFFDVLAAELQKCSKDFTLSKIQIQISSSYYSTQSLRPLCLGITKPCFKDACSRIQRVLQHQFNPPIKLIIMPCSIKLEEYSVRFHLQKRMNQHFC